MEEMLMQLVQATLHHQEVGLLAGSDGIQLLAYPLDKGVIVGLGTGPGSGHRIRSILRRRTENLPRYGIWLPALFNDGSCFVMMRVSDIWEGAAILPPDALAAAGELVS